MKALVTGASGFLGKNLTELLTEVGVKFVPTSRAEVGGCEEEEFVKWLEPQKFDVIFHLGSPVKHDFDQHDAENTITGIKNIITYAIKHDSHVIFPSSISIYGSSTLGQAFTETSPPCPFSLYAATKLVCESLLLHHLHNLTIFRVANGYGPYETSKGSNASIVTQLCNNVLHNTGTVSLYDDGLPKRDFVYVDDIVGPMVKCAIEQVDGLYNLGTGETISLYEIMELIAFIAGKTPIVESRKSPLDYISETKVNTQQLINWYKTPMTPIVEGIAKTMRFMREQSA